MQRSMFILFLAMLAGATAIWSVGGSVALALLIAGGFGSLALLPQSGQRSRRIASRIS